MGDLTLEECVEYSRHGWTVVLHNGRAIGLKKKGASVTGKCAKQITTVCNYSRQGKECQYE